MIINPTLTSVQIDAKIEEVELKLEEMAEIGDKITSSGAMVEYNNRYSHYKNQLEQLYSMKTQKTMRGE